MNFAIPSCALVLAGLLGMTSAGMHAADHGTTPAGGSHANATTNNGSLDKRDAKFLRKAAHCNHAEIHFSEVAAKRTLVQEDKAFAKKVQEQHRTLQSELEKLAKAKGVTLPTTMDEDMQKKGNDLTSSDDKNFAENYLECQIEAHKDAIDLYEDAAEDAKDADVRAFASKHLPTLQAHLAEARQLEKKY